MKLPLKKAVELAALQNWERDLIKSEGDPEDYPGSWADPETRKLYKDEVKELFKHSGENYFPDFPFHDFITIK